MGVQVWCEIITVLWPVYKNMLNFLYYAKLTAFILYYREQDVFFLYYKRKVVFWHFYTGGQQTLSGSRMLLLEGSQKTTHALSPSFSSRVVAINQASVSLLKSLLFQYYMYTQRKKSYFHCCWKLQPDVGSNCLRFAVGFGAWKHIEDMRSHDVKRMQVVVAASLNFIRSW